MFKFFTIFIFQLYYLFFNLAISPRSKNYVDQDEKAIYDSITKYRNLSIQSYKKGDLEGFGSYSNKVLAIAEKHNLSEFQIKALINLAIYHQRKDQYKEALTKYLKAEEATSFLNDSAYLKIVLNTNLGNFYYRIEDYDKAKLTMKKVLTLSNYQEKEKKKKIRIAALNTLGNATSDQKEYKDAFVYFDELKELLKNEESKKDKLATVYCNVAECYRETGHFLKAIENSQKALELLGEENYIETEATAKLCIGISYYRLEEYNKALLFLKSSNEIAIEDGFLHTKMESHKYLTKVYESLNNIEDAFVEQKNYTVAREAFLKTLTASQRLKLEKESEKKSEQINIQEGKIDFLNKEKIIYIFVGIILFSLFILFLVSYYKKKKFYKNDTQELKGENIFLESENELLRDKLNKTALVLKRENTTKKNKKTSLTEEEQEIYKEKILNYMEASRPYLNTEIKQLDVAKELEMTVHVLSEVLNTCFKQNFNSFINLYRINEAKLLMKKPEYKKYTIITIAYDAGFSSKSSFNRVFKNLVGCTPTEFQKKHEVL